jgi:hypothetical protein
MERVMLDMERIRREYPVLYDRILDDEGAYPLSPDTAYRFKFSEDPDYISVFVGKSRWISYPVDIFKFV